MTYKDTIIKQCEIIWKPLKIRQTKDGKIDMKVNIPLTALFDAQAKRSFMRGVAEALSFVGNCQESKTIITTELLDSMFTMWGIPELSKLTKKTQE